MPTNKEPYCQTELGSQFTAKKMSEALEVVQTRGSKQSNRFGMLKEYVRANISHSKI